MTETKAAEKSEAAAQPATTGQVPGTGFAVYCSGCNYTAPVKSASARDAPGQCPQCGHALVVLDADERQTTDRALAAHAEKVGRKGARSQAGPAPSDTKED